MLPIDELNTLEAGIRVTMEDPDMPVETKKKMIKEDVLDFLLLAYLMGKEQTEESFNRSAKMDDDKLSRNLYQKFDGKDFTEEIDEHVEANDVAKINVVADTNMTRMYNAGAYDTAESFGGGVKEWVTMEDDRVRATHEYINRVRVPLKEKFYTFDGDSALYPGAFSDPANNCGCRCQIVVHPDED